MIRKLVDYKKLDHEVAALLIETFPHGYGDDDIIAFKNHHGEWIEAVEVRTADTVYLIKISKSLSNFIANFDDNIEKELAALPKSEQLLETTAQDDLENEQGFENDPKEEEGF